MYKKNQFIPKTIYYCWFGGGKKDKLFDKCLSSWKKFLPEYKIVEINENNFDIHKNNYVEEAYKMKKWAFVSDYARLWCIYKNGGIYLDTDVELIRELDLTNIRTFFCLQNKKTIATGLGFGSEPNNGLIKKMMDDYENIGFIKKKNELDLTSCPTRNTKSVEYFFSENGVIDIKSKGDIIIYPPEYFCPIDFETKQMKITENTIAIHWFSGTWLSADKKIKLLIKKVLIKVFGYDTFNKIKSIGKKYSNQQDRI